MYGTNVIYMFLYKIEDEWIEYGLYKINEIKTIIFL